RRTAIRSQTEWGRGAAHLWRPGKLRPLVREGFRGERDGEGLAVAQDVERGGPIDRREHGPLANLVPLCEMPPGRPEDDVTRVQTGGLCGRAVVDRHHGGGPGTDVLLLARALARLPELDPHPGGRDPSGDRKVVVERRERLGTRQPQVLGKGHRWDREALASPERLVGRALRG